jgi:hypothetical protein
VESAIVFARYQNVGRLLFVVLYEIILWLQQRFNSLEEGNPVFFGKTILKTMLFRPG